MTPSLAWVALSPRAGVVVQPSRLAFLAFRQREVLRGAAGRRVLLLPTPALRVDLVQVVLVVAIEEIDDICPVVRLVFANQTGKGTQVEWPFKDFKP